MSFFSSFFKDKTTQESAPRSLNHPKDLQIGDIVAFGFTAQSGIGRQSFKVDSIRTYDFDGDTENQTVFTLKGADSTLYLSVVQDRGIERVELARTLLPEDVAQIFDIERFANLFEPDSGVHNTLNRIDEPETYSGWTAAVYRQEAGNQIYVDNTDLRGDSGQRYADDGAACDYYLLVSDDRNYAVQAEVYDGGRTDVYLKVYIPLSKIEGLWPAAQD
ncbi:MAG: hypothetical protein GXP10_04670 [Gammaproteobacteria bacterium]|nr:hypothetical protein [Gammaproteobacteria bacterium]